MIQVPSPSFTCAPQSSVNTLSILAPYESLTPPSRCDEGDPKDVKCLQRRKEGALFSFPSRSHLLSGRFADSTTREFGSFTMGPHAQWSECRQPGNPFAWLSTSFQSPPATGGARAARPQRHLPLSLQASTRHQPIHKRAARLDCPPPRRASRRPAGAGTGGLAGGLAPQIAVRARRT